MVKKEVLVTPCCATEIKPAAGFQSVQCCGQTFTREDLEDQSEQS